MNKTFNKFVPRHVPSIECAKTITVGCKTPTEKYKKITEFIKKNFVYDYIRAYNIPKKNAYPDLNRTWDQRMGICMDIASLTTGMLRAVDLDAKMCIGNADGKWHAWVETKIGNRMYRFDHSGKAKQYKTEKRY